MKKLKAVGIVTGDADCALLRTIFVSPSSLHSMACSLLIGPIIYVSCKLTLATNFHYCCNVVH